MEIGCALDFPMQPSIVIPPAGLRPAQPENAACAGIGASLRR
jgi:hypothetical protein